MAWLMVAGLLAAPAAILILLGIMSMVWGDVQYVLQARRSELILTRWPSSAWIYLQAGWSLLTKSRRTDHAKALQNLEDIKVAMVKPVPFNDKRLCSYLHLMGLPPSIDVPLMYPIVESFRLIIQAMLLPAFPFNVLGSVLTKHTTTTFRPIRPNELLSFSVHISPDGWRTTSKGDTEVDITSEAVSPTDGQVVWRAVTTAVILNPKRNKSGTKEPAAADTSQGSTEVIATWQLSSRVGRQYGWLNGDLNPIHLHAITSNLFGFKRPIAHALFLVGKAEASLRAHGVVPVYPAVVTTEFKRPTLLPATLKCVKVHGGTSGGVEFIITTEDGAKPVLIGCFSTFK